MCCSRKDLRLHFLYVLQSIRSSSSSSMCCSRKDHHLHLLSCVTAERIILSIFFMLQPRGIIIFIFSHVLQQKKASSSSSPMCCSCHHLHLRRAAADWMNLHLNTERHDELHHLSCTNLRSWSWNNGTHDRVASSIMYKLMKPTKK